MSERFENVNPANQSYTDSSHALVAGLFEPRSPKSGGGNSGAHDGDGHHAVTPKEEHPSSGQDHGHVKGPDKGHHKTHHGKDAVEPYRPNSDSQASSTSKVGEVSSSSSSQGGNANGGDATSSATGGTGGDGGNSNVRVDNSVTSRDFYMEATQAPSVSAGAPPATRFEYQPGNGSKFSADSNGSIDTSSLGLNIGAPGIGGFGFAYGESRASNMEAVTKTAAQQQTSFDMFISNVADPSLNLPRVEIQKGALKEVLRGQQERASVKASE